MDWENCVVALSALGAITFAVVAVRRPEKRLRLTIPIVLLVLLAVYETFMAQWEKTVHAPIRLDFMVEIPLMFLFLAAGIAALIWPPRGHQQK